MNYRIRITLPGIKGFFRVYEASGTNTLYTFHKQIRTDLEFPMDQPILFKAFDAEGAVVARWALVDLGKGTVDQIRIADAVKAGVTSFDYFYDIASKKKVIVTIEAEAPESMVKVPTLMESKGPIPLEFENGYVAFEDLPEDRRRLPGERRASDGDDEDDNDEDDDDDEDDGDEDDGEEEDVIYDENE